MPEKQTQPLDKVNIKIPQGSEEYITILYEDETGLPIDLTGYDAIMEIRTKPQQDQSKPPLLRVSTLDGGLVIMPLIGRIDITLSSLKTSALKSNSFYDLFLVAGAYKKMLLYGEVEIIKKVTNF
jgi:hypothetical protein